MERDQVTAPDAKVQAEAERLALLIIGACGGASEGRSIEQSKGVIAAALHEAEQRGARAERETCGLIAEQCWHGPGDHGCSHGSEIARAIRARSEGEAVNCQCAPCSTCGYKHYCNVSIPHPHGWVRIGGCPAEKARTS